MSFKVTFYNFKKHYNSTKRPGNSDTTKVEYNCNILRGSSIYDPKIEIDFGLSSTPAQYNYCVIPAFDSRYYFIREWTFAGGLWIASLQEDVLASWRNTIGDTSRYILRAAASWNGNIMDAKYPMKAGCTFSRSTVGSPYSSINAGCFVIGCVSKGGNFGSLTYHAMTAAEMGSLATALIDPSIISGANNFSLNDASAGLQLNLIDPMQYIKSCIWLPFAASEIPGTDIPASGPTGGFDIFNFHFTGFTHRILSNTAPYVQIFKQFTRSSHPDAATRGNYLNYSPYTIATLSYPPFGVIEIDTSVLGNATYLYTYLTIDPLNGKGILQIEANNTILNRVEAQIGVPIALSQVTRDYVGAVNNALGAVGNIASAISNPAGIVGNMVGAAQGLVNAGVSLVPRANTIGSGGGFSHLQGDFELDFQFFRPVDDDLTNNGRPLCAYATPSTLGGYMILQDGSIEGATTSREGEEIRRLLETGFYWE
jgi:hypothetical protein